MAKRRDYEFQIKALDAFSRPLMAFNREVSQALSPVRKLSADLAGLSRLAGLGKVAKAMGGVKTRAGEVGAELKSLAGWGAAGLAGLGYGFKSLLLDKAAQFETFTATLEQLEGGSEGARKSMAWISDFAATTPYELAEVTDSFVKLRSYGLDPTSGLLRTLGDTASAMGKSIEAAVEAIADAVTGENERLKEFGITARKTGNRIVYEYTDKSGKQLRKAVKANSRAMIQSTLEAIWNEKYGGAMAKRGKTWGGLWSNLMDQVSRFEIKIMEFGAFDWMKDKLGGLLDLLNAMAADGSLDALAKEWGEKLTSGLEKAWDAGKAVWGVLSGLGGVLAWSADLVGGWGNLALVLAGIVGGKLLVSLALLAQSLYVLGAAFLTSPIGWLVLGLGALAASIAYCWKKFEGFRTVVKALWADQVALGKALWEGFAKIGQAVMDFLVDPLGALGQAMGNLGAWLGGKLGLTVSAGEGRDSGAMDGEPPAKTRDGEEGDFWARLGAKLGLMSTGGDRASGAMAFGPPAGAARVQREISDSSSTTVQRSESRIAVTFDNLPAGARVRQEGDADVDLDMGYANMAWG